MGTADDLIDLLIDPHPFPECCLHRTNGTFGQRTMNAFTLGTIQEVTTQTLFAVFMGIGVIAHVVGTNQLIVMRRLNDFALMAALLFPFPDLQNDTGCQLVVKIIQMAHVRLKILQHQTDLLPCLCRINGLNRVQQFG